MIRKNRVRILVLIAFTRKRQNWGQSEF